MISKRIIDLKHEIERLRNKKEMHKDNYEQATVIQTQIDNLYKELNRLRFEENLRTKIAFNKEKENDKKF